LLSMIRIFLGTADQVNKTALKGVFIFQRKGEPTFRTRAL
jgi:hypothetical protein